MLVPHPYGDALRRDQTVDTDGIGRGTPFNAVASMVYGHRSGSLGFGGPPRMHFELVSSNAPTTAP